MVLMAPAAAVAAGQAQEMALPFMIQEKAVAGVALALCGLFGNLALKG